MRTRAEVTAFCRQQEEVIEDYPFRDQNWTMMRHVRNRKTFACVYERMGQIWLNVKCDPEWRDFWRSAYASVLPAYHMNKEHWNSVILDGTVPETEIRRMILESYALTRPHKSGRNV